MRFGDGGRPAPHRPPELFATLAVRHTNHRAYDGRPVPADVLDRLRAVAAEDGVVLHLTSDEAVMRAADALVVRADAVEFADPAFRAELGHWIGQGVFGTSWLMSKLGQLAVTWLDTGASQGRKDSAALMSSPVLGVFCTRADDRASQVRVGQAYQRLSLLAAASGVWCQPVSQVVQVPETRAGLAGLLPGPGLLPQHPFRMGYAEPERHRTPRRPLDEVIVA